MKQMVRNWKWLETLKDRVFRNKETKTIEIGENIEIDGNIEVNGNIGENFETTLKTILGGGDTHTVIINGSTISLQQFIDNCENGVYKSADVGTIATVSGLMGGIDGRIILIGVEHDVLSKDNTTKAKTTWQYYDCPMKDCQLGLQFNIFDLDGTSGVNKINSFLEGTSMNWLPSNKHGYSSAVSLINSLTVCFNCMPNVLKEHIKLVTKGTITRRATRSSTAGDNAYEEKSSSLLFHLSGKELDNNDSENEGTTYAYFDSNLSRERYFGETIVDYWTRSSGSYQNSDKWKKVSYVGDVRTDTTASSIAIAPAFCI